MRDTITADAYTRSATDIASPKFLRWLIIVDVMPDVGNIAGYQSIALPKRTLNVVAKGDLAGSVDLIRRMARTLKAIAVETDWQNDAFRYSFSLVDLAGAYCVTVEQLLDWDGYGVEGHSSIDPATALTLPVDRTRAAAIARMLSGKEIPSTLLLDATDPIALLNSMDLLPSMRAVTNPTPNLINRVYDGSVSSSEFAAATEGAEPDWVAGLSTLPNRITASLDRVVAERAEIIKHQLECLGCGTSPRAVHLPAIINRSVVRCRAKLAHNAYREVIVGKLPYTDNLALDAVVLAQIEQHVTPHLPSFAQLKAA